VFPPRIRDCPRGTKRASEWQEQEGYLQSWDRDERIILTTTAKTRAAGTIYQSQGTSKTNTKTLASAIKAPAMAPPG